MQTQFEHITAFKQYQIFSRESNVLFATIKNLPQNVLKKSTRNMETLSVNLNQLIYFMRKLHVDFTR
jgi:hypothetical protein